jgi:hypothetical protein
MTADPSDGVNVVDDLKLGVLIKIRPDQGLWKQVSPARRLRSPEGYFNELKYIYRMHGRFMHGTLYEISTSMHWNHATATRSVAARPHARRRSRL